MTIDVPDAAPRPYPLWLRVAVLACALGHDTSIIVAGVWAFNFTPPTVREALGPIDWVWVGMLIAGGLCAAIGAILRKTAVEITGCILMAFGMFTWSVSALTQPMPTPTSISVGAAFFAGGVAILWRLFALLVGSFLRVRN